MGSSGPGGADTGEALQVVVIGVSGTGKSAVGAALAARLGWPFIEGDDLHPPRNVAKMAAGQPLDDDDRAPWLESIRLRAAERSAAGRSTVITCSALKRKYRDALRAGVGAMFFVHLDGSYEVLQPRMARRERHFMPTRLLRSQLETLEPLGVDEDGAVVDVSGDVETVVAAAVQVVADRLRR